MANSKEKLFSEFAPTTTEAWKEKAVADLKGGGRCKLAEKFFFTICHSLFVNYDL